jgi:hypothetical protein
VLRGPHVTEVDREGLETVVLGLEFRIRTKHFKRGDMKIKCLARIATVYWKTNELSIESYRTENKAPVMESRETRPQGHTHAEHILGKSSGRLAHAATRPCTPTRGRLVKRICPRSRGCATSRASTQAPRPFLPTLYIALQFAAEFMFIISALPTYRLLGQRPPPRPLGAKSTWERGA